MKNYLKGTLALVACAVLLLACSKETSVINNTPVDSTATPPKTSPPPDNTNTNAANDVAETKTLTQKGIVVSINGNIGGYQEALPARYDSTTKKYPLLICIHGVGELGDGNGDLWRAGGVGTPAVIKNGQFPVNIVVNGKNYSFIVLSPQFRTWPSGSDVNTFLNYAINKYRIDTTRIYMTGLSMGGGVTWDFAAAYPKRLAAIVPICGASSSNSTKAKNIAQANIAVWAFHNEDDPTVSVNNSKGYVKDINSFNPTPAARLTLWPTGGHDAWSKATNPTYKENNMNIYEWMLQYKK